MSRPSGVRYQTQDGGVGFSSVGAVGGCCVGNSRSSWRSPEKSLLPASSRSTRGAIALYRSFDVIGSTVSLKPGCRAARTAEAPEALL